MGVSIGLDLGEKRVGVAVSDESGIVATALKTLEFKGKKSLLADLQKIVHDYQVEAVVVGLPKTLKGEMGEAAQKVTGQVDWLKSQLEKTVEWVLWDERLTTQEVEKMLIQADMSRMKRKKVRDQLAAQRILQNYLDQKKYFGNSS